MNSAHLHLMLTHFPIVGIIIGILTLAYGQFANSDAIKKVALVMFIALAFLTIAVFLTGNEAEETVENLPGVSENLIENHEELAEKALWLMGFLGVLSIINFYVILKKLTYTKTINLITLIVSLGTFAVFAKVGNEGGKIRHTEIRTTNQNNIDSFNTENENDDD